MERYEERKPCGRVGEAGSCGNSSKYYSWQGGLKLHFQYLTSHIPSDMKISRDIGQGNWVWWVIALRDSLEHPGIFFTIFHGERKEMPTSSSLNPHLGQCFLLQESGICFNYGSRWKFFVGEREKKGNTKIEERERGMQEQVSLCRTFLKCLCRGKVPGRAERTSWDQSCAKMVWELRPPGGAQAASENVSYMLDESSWKWEEFCRNKSDPLKKGRL